VIRPGAVGSRVVVGSIALVGVVALSVAGCSSDDKPTPKASPGSTSSSSSGASSGALKDESAAVLGWTAPGPVAKTVGNLEEIGTRVRIPATAEIISVRAGSTSTVLTWQVSSATDIPLQGQSLEAPEYPAAWPGGVRLVDPVGKKSYAVYTMEDTHKLYCVCSRYPSHVGPDPVRMTAAYPPLPASATSVSVRIPNFAPVTVPVTR
jgi:hypothetical protein